ncbi:MAG: peptide chain release factor N(5)-glutamine methyltransferase [Clostridia bacterium]
MELKKYYLETLEKFKNAGIDESAEVLWIFAYVLKVKRSYIFSIKDISEADKVKIDNIVCERLKRKPLDKILGFSEFYGYKFLVNEDVLIPRPETEELVELALQNITSQDSVLDVGTGSGDIAITIKKKSNAKVTAVDVSNSALLVAQQNALLNDADVTMVLSDLFNGIVGQKFDKIISNPPYIKSCDINYLEDEVKKFEPHIALDGGESGFVFYEKIISEAPSLLNKHGQIFFEVGDGQAEVVSNLLKKDFTNIKIKKDLEGIERIVYAELKDIL